VRHCYTPIPSHFNRVIPVPVPILSYYSIFILIPILLWISIPILRRSSRNDKHDEGAVLITSSPGRERSKHCDPHVSNYVCLYVALCLYFRSHISENTHIQSSRNVLHMLPVAVARSSSDDSAIRYVLPVSCIWRHVSHNWAYTRSQSQHSQNFGCGGKQCVMTSNLRILREVNIAPWNTISYSICQTIPNRSPNIATKWLIWPSTRREILRIITSRPFEHNRERSFTFTFLFPCECLILLMARLHSV